MPDTIASVLAYEADLTKTIQKTILRDLFVTEDKNAHTFRVKITRAGEPVDLTGATVTGYFMRYKDRVSIPLTGTVEGSEAVLTLNDGCYSTRTMFCVTLCVALGGAKHAVFAGEGQMVLNRSEAIVDPENVIPSVEDIIAQYDLMVSGTNAANTAASSANTAAGKANTAASTANTATTNANNATVRANNAAAALETAPVPTGTVVTYQAGTSATTPPTGTWLANPPTVPQGQYLWTRTVQSFTNGNPVTSYSVARQGMDGSGSVAAVDGVSPNSSGNVVLGAVRSVNGSKPDANGNVEVDAGGGTVQSVNNVQPDGSGNITLTGANVPVSSTDTRKVSAAVAQHDNTIKTLTAAEFEALTTEEFAALYESGVRTVLVEQTGEVGSDPIYLRVDVAQSLTNAQKATVLTSIGAVAAIRNAVDNSDFRYWVAQAGIGGNHGEVAYGGDRWILDSGTITGTTNTNGLGYGSITLNGTIRQIIANPQETMTAFIGMISGTATVTYTYTDGTGELTITSAGGVLDWVMLLPGEWESAPPYVPKDYVVEFMECQKYFVLYGGESTSFCGIGLSQTADMFDVVLPLTTPMRCKPSMSCIGTITAANGVHIDITAGFGVEAQNGLSLFLRANKDSAFEAGKSYLLRIPAGSMLHICADL